MLCRRRSCGRNKARCYAEGLSSVGISRGNVILRRRLFILGSHDNDLADVCGITDCLGG
jgi:hypothetical protein